MRTITVRADLVIAESELVWRFSRAGGPGGQGVNTTDSRVMLSFDLANSPAIPEPMRQRMLARLASRLSNGTLTVVASEHRSQLRNREAARARLVGLLREAAAPPALPRRPTRPSRAAQERRLAGKRLRGRRKRQRAGRDDGE